MLETIIILGVVSLGLGSMFSHLSGFGVLFIIVSIALCTSGYNAIKGEQRGYNTVMFMGLLFSSMGLLWLNQYLQI